MFLQAIRQHHLLGEKYSSMLLHPQAPFTREAEWLEIPGLRIAYGYAFEFLMRNDSEAPFCIYKDGANDGVAARFSYYPEKDIRLILLANQDCNVWDMTKKIQLEIAK